MTSSSSTKVLSCLLVFIALLTTTSLAQRTTSKQKSSTTQPGSTTVVSGRQQELYNKYHGYKKKPTGSAVVKTPVARPVEKSTRVKQSVVKPPPATAVKPPKPANNVAPSPSVNPPVAKARVNVSQQTESIESSPSSQIQIGIRGGLTYPFYLTSDALISPKLGFVGGVTFIVRMGKLLLQPEVNYARNATQVSFLNIRSNEALDVLQVPLLVKFSSNNYAGNRFFVNVGPYVSCILSASEDGKKVPLNRTLTDNSSRFAFGVAAGVGISLKAGPGHATFEIRGLYPLSATIGSSATNANVLFGQGTLGYYYPFGVR